ncbi:MAG: NfeD family protein [Clostridia bacterium]|nr:NfeD family protein [Clostridia bacterium]
MLEWWNSLGSLAQIFACVAIPSTIVLFIQTVMMFVGIGHDSDIADGVHFDGDLDADISGAEAVHDGIFGHDITDAEIDHDISGFEGLRIFTVRGIIAFLVVFGWVGVALDSGGVHKAVTCIIATVCGFAVMVLMAFLMRAVMRLRSDGNADNRNAIGVAGRVYLTVPPERSGEGKVNIMLQGSYVERDAVTDEAEPIPTGSEVVVIGLSGQTTLVVKRK